jgi:hypothetical protein
VAHHEGQFIVYSLGPDRQDGQGAYDPKRWLSGGPDDIGQRAWDVGLRHQAPTEDDPAP